MHSSCLKALNDEGRLRLKQVLSTVSMLNHYPWLPLPPPPPRLTRAWGECFHWPMGLKCYKNLTWKTKGRHNQCTDSHRPGLTEGRTLLKHPPPLGIDMEAPSNPWWVSSGTELDNEPNQYSPLRFFSPQGPESWLSSAFCANILAHFEVRFQKLG